MNPYAQHVKDSCEAAMTLTTLQVGSPEALADCRKRSKQAIREARLISATCEPAGPDYSSEWAEREAMENPE